MKVTAVLNLHREAWLANSSLRSLQSNLAALESEGVATEAILLLDSPDELTRAFAREFCPPQARIVEVDCQDLGEARNAAVRGAAGDFLGFLDGDDIWGEEWLLRALRAAGQSASSVWHPEASVFFGTPEPYWLLHRDDDVLGADWQTLALRNHWTALCFARRDLFQAVPYRRRHRQRRLGYEDWAFNMDTAAAGYRHLVVPNTLHFVRMRGDSLVRQTAQEATLVSLSDLFIKRIGRIGLEESAPTGAARDAGSSRATGRRA